MPTGSAEFLMVGLAFSAIFPAWFDFSWLSARHSAALVLFYSDFRAVYYDASVAESKRKFRDDFGS